MLMTTFMKGKVIEFFADWLFFLSPLMLPYDGNENLEILTQLHIL
jgi:hypothetical protein